MRLDSYRDWYSARLSAPVQRAAIPIPRPLSTTPPTLVVSYLPRLPPISPDRRQAGGASRGIVLADHPGDGQRSANRAVGVVVDPRQAAPHRHDRIADILVDHALLVIDAGAEQGEMMVEQVGGVLLGQLLGLR